MLDVLLLTFRVLRKVTPAGGAQGVEEGTTTEELGVVLGEDLLALRRPNGRTVYDFSAARVLEVDDAAKTYRDDSLYSIAGFREIEWGNRRMLLDVIRAGGGTPAPGLEPCYVTDYFGLAPPGQDAGESPQAVQEGGDLVFRRDDEALVRFAKSDVALAPHQLDGWRRFLAHKGHVHPAVRRRLVESGCAPSRLEARHFSGAAWETTELVLQGRSPTEPPATKVPAGYGLASDPPRPIDALAARVDTEEALDESDAGAAQRVECALQARRPLEALLLAHLHLLQTGRDELFAGVVPRVESDGGVRKLFKLLRSPPRNARAARRASKVLGRLRRKAGAAALVLDVYLANLYEGVGEDEEAQRFFLAALGENPRIAGGWCDLGRVYYGRYRTGEAWQCWDTARRLCPGHPLLGEHDAREQGLRESYPDFF